MWKLKFTSQLKRRPGTGPRPVEIRFFPVFFRRSFLAGRALNLAHCRAYSGTETTTTIRPGAATVATTAFCCTIHKFFTTCQRRQNGGKEV